MRANLSIHLQSPRVSCPSTSIFPVKDGHLSISVDDDTVFCDPTNYTAYVNCFNCLVANGEPDADAIDAQQSLDSLTQTCLSANFTLASTGTITASSTTFGPFTTFPDDAATDTAVTTTTSSGVTTGTASTTVGARTATTGTATGSGATIAADGSTKTTFAAQSASASASALVVSTLSDVWCITHGTWQSASASKTGGVGMNAVSGRWGVLGGVMAVFGLLLAQ